MNDQPFQRGDVVWHPIPFKAPSRERPFLLLSDATHPFHGNECAVVGLPRTNRPPAVVLERSAWATNTPGTDSYAPPWYVFSIKHTDIIRPRGTVTDTATSRVASAVGRILGVP